MPHRRDADATGPHHGTARGRCFQRARSTPSREAAPERTRARDHRSRASSCPLDPRSRQDAEIGAPRRRRTSSARVTAGAPEVEDGQSVDGPQNVAVEHPAASRGRLRTDALDANSLPFEVEIDHDADQDANRGSVHLEIRDLVARHVHFRGSQFSDLEPGDRPTISRMPSSIRAAPEAGHVHSSGRTPHTPVSARPGSRSLAGRPGGRRAVPARSRSGARVRMAPAFPEASRRLHSVEHTRRTEFERRSVGRAPDVSVPAPRADLRTSR